MPNFHLILRWYPNLRPKKEIPLFSVTKALQPPNSFAHGCSLHSRCRVLHRQGIGHSAFRGSWLADSPSFPPFHWSRRLLICLFHRSMHRTLNEVIWIFSLSLFIGVATVTSFWNGYRDVDFSGWCRPSVHWNRDFETFVRKKVASFSFLPKSSAISNELNCAKLRYFNFGKSICHD